MSSDADKVLADAVRDAAKKLARAMNAAGNAGLHLSLEMRPHESFTKGGCICRAGYVPILEIWRMLHA